MPADMRPRQTRILRGAAARADRGLSRGGIGLCRGEARLARQDGGSGADGRGTGDGARPVGAASPPLPARACEHRHLRGAARRQLRLDGLGHVLARLAVGSARRSRSWSSSIGGPGPISSPPSRPAGPPSIRCSACACPTGAASMRSRALFAAYLAEETLAQAAPIVDGVGSSGVEAASPISAAAMAGCSPLCFMPIRTFDGILVRPAANHRSRQGLSCSRSASPLA